MAITLPINLPSPLNRVIGDVALYVAPLPTVTAGYPGDPPASGAGGYAYCGLVESFNIDTGREQATFTGGQLKGALGMDRTSEKCVITGNVRVWTREAQALFGGMDITTDLALATSISSIACTNIVGAGPIVMPITRPDDQSSEVEYRWLLSLAAPTTAASKNLRRYLEIWRGVPKITGAIVASPNDYSVIPFQIDGLVYTDITDAALTAHPEICRFGRITDAVS